jgi:S-adenosylmethionine/arginine decarboxylase-like enzyme
MVRIHEADYCTGMSLNADFWWSPEDDVSFLTVQGGDKLVDVIARGVEAGHMKVFGKNMTRYSTDPSHGFTYLFVLGQSHIVLHTWPEKHMMNIDVFTCGSEGDPHAILKFIEQSLHPKHVQMKQNERGVRKDIHNTSEKPDTPQEIKPPTLPPGVRVPAPV